MNDAWLDLRIGDQVCMWDRTDRLGTVINLEWHGVWPVIRVRWQDTGDQFVESTEEFVFVSRKTGPCRR